MIVVFCLCDENRRWTGAVSIQRSTAKDNANFLDCNFTSNAAIQLGGEQEPCKLFGSLQLFAGAVYHEGQALFSAPCQLTMIGTTFELNTANSSGAAVYTLSGISINGTFLVCALVQARFS